MNDLKPNIFTKAFEYGENKLKDGISYLDMVRYLETEGFSYAKNPGFRDWFYKNFHCSQLEGEQDGYILAGEQPPGYHYDAALSFLKGEAYLNYLEYVEVREALKNSRISTRIAIAAIGVSCVIGIIQIILQLCLTSK